MSTDTANCRCWAISVEVDREPGAKNAVGMSFMTLALSV